MQQSSPRPPLIATSPAAAVEVLALSRLRRGACGADLDFYEAADRELFTSWARSGQTSWPQDRVDRRGQVLKLYLKDLAEARPLLSSIPSVSAEVLTFDLVPLVRFWWVP